jgi:glycosyltransferase involved in cell wall biosynthesis
MMKVLYDHQVFSWQRFGGISRYFYELMNNSDGLYDCDVSGRYSGNEYIKPLNLYKSFPVRFHFKGKTRIINQLNKIDSIKKIKSGKYDIIHPTYYDPYVLGGNRNPLVITVYDMIHELYSHYFENDISTLKNKKTMIHSADVIIAISENTKKDILKFYPDISGKKISVIHLGTSFKITEKHEDKENYILFVGQRSRYKNFDNFLQAVAPLLIKYDINLVCAGQKFTKKELELLGSLHISNRVVFDEFKDDKLLELYSKALTFVFPSLYEGFGIPVLEAFAAGCPAILSNTSSLPEIGGVAAVYFDPHSIADMRIVIERVITSRGLQKELEDKGRERVKQFSWNRCAHETAGVYKGLSG